MPALRHPLPRRGRRHQPLARPAHDVHHADRDVRRRSARSRRAIKDLCFAFLLLQGAMLGAFVALDLFLFYVFWELMLIPMYVMIGIWGGVETHQGARTSSSSTRCSASMLMLARHPVPRVDAHASVAGVLELRLLRAPARWCCRATRSVALLRRRSRSRSSSRCRCARCTRGCPDAHVQAPTGGSIILAAVHAEARHVRLPALLAWASSRGRRGRSAPTSRASPSLGGILYGALVRVEAGRREAPRRVLVGRAPRATSCSASSARRRPAIEGAVLQMVNHGISTGALFLLVGVIYDRRHTRHDRRVRRPREGDAGLRGALRHRRRWRASACPGTNGFIGEFMVITGTFVSQRARALQTAMPGRGRRVGVILAAVYMLTVVQKMFFGPLDEPEERAPRRTSTRARRVARRAAHRADLRHRALPEHLPVAHDGQRERACSTASSTAACSTNSTPAIRR